MATERSVVSRLIKAALAREYTVSVFDSEEWAIRRSNSHKAIMAEIMATDEDTLRFRKDDEIIGSVYLAYGNSPDEVIADYSDNDRIAELVAEVEHGH